MKQAELKRKTALTADPDKVRAFVDRGRRASGKAMSKPRAIGECTPAQRERVKDRGCVVCGERPVDPTHLIPRGLCPEGADDPRAVVPCCRLHHREYDHARTLSLLEHLEPHFREELAFAVQRFGLLSTLERVTNVHWRETSL